MGWATATTIVRSVISVALLAVFVAIEQRAPAPLVRLGIRRSGPLARANVGGITGARRGIRPTRPLPDVGGSGARCPETTCSPGD